MKAVVVKEFGPLGSHAVTDMPAPPLGAGQVRIAVSEAGVNFGDTLIVAGQYQVKPPFPFSPGMEAAGIVIETDAAATRFRPGDRVMATCVYGGFAEEVCVDESKVFAVHDSVSLTTASVFPVCYGTAHHALVDRAALRPGERVLVLGAGSGVALTTVELGKLLGAHVIAAAGSKEKLDAARTLGADACINYREEPLRDRIRQLTGGAGVDVVFDPVGGELSEESLRCMAPGGKSLVVGFAAGRFPVIPANLLLLKEWTVMGVNTAVLIETDPDTYRERFAQMMQQAAAGALKPLIAHRFPLDDAIDAMALMASRKVVGRVTVVVRP
jgi:NADPH2:quinone reductase